MDILSIKLPVWLFVLETAFALVGFIFFVGILMAAADRGRKDSETTV